MFSKLFCRQLKTYQKCTHNNDYLLAECAVSEPNIGVEQLQSYCSLCYNCCEICNFLLFYFMSHHITLTPVTSHPAISNCGDSSSEPRRLISGCFTDSLWPVKVVVAACQSCLICVLTLWGKMPQCLDVNVKVQETALDFGQSGTERERLKKCWYSSVQSMP